MNEYMERMKEANPEALKIDDHDDAIIGIGYIFQKALFVYSETKIIETLMNRDEMTFDEAIQYLEYNISGAYMGEHTPIIMDDLWEGK